MKEDAEFVILRALKRATMPYTAREIADTEPEATRPAPSTIRTYLHLWKSNGWVTCNPGAGPRNADVWAITDYARNNVVRSRRVRDSGDQ